MARGPAKTLSGPKMSRADHAKIRATRYGSALQTSTLSAYAKSYGNFIKFCHDRVSDFDPNQHAEVEDVITYAHCVCEGRNNAKALSQLFSGIKTFATKVLGRPQWSPLEEAAFKTAIKTGKRTIGIKQRNRADPIGRAKLREIWDRAALSRTGTPRLFITFAQLCVAHGFVTRSNELLGPKAALAGRLFLLDPCPQFPHGAAKLHLVDPKGALLANEKGGIEVAFAVGTGEPTCPVALIQEVMQAYGLYDPARASEPLFAAMRPDATRIFSDPVNWLGAQRLTGREFNAQIKILCARAGIASFTGRATRHGAATDMLSAGVDKLLVMVAGRWRSVDAISTYTVLTADGAARIARALATH